MKGAEMLRKQMVVPTRALQRSQQMAVTMVSKCLAILLHTEQK
jgi:hypothetical protein